MRGVVGWGVVAARLEARPLGHSNPGSRGDTSRRLKAEREMTGRVLERVLATAFEGVRLTTLPLGYGPKGQPRERGEGPQSTQAAPLIIGCVNASGKGKDGPAL